MIEGCEGYDIKRLRRWFENRRHKQRMEAGKQGAAPAYEATLRHGKSAFRSTHTLSYTKSFRVSVYEWSGGYDAGFVSGRLDVQQ